jgi:hypothetical protein
VTTERDICAALHRRYNPPSNGRPGEGYVCIEEARSGAGFQGNNGQCDFLAINTWQSRGLTVIGHEIKVSRTDLLKELAQPEKAEQFGRFCHMWWLVMPSELYAKMDHQVPTAWGVLTASDKGRLTEAQKPQRNRTPDAVPVWWWIGWLAQIDRQHKRQLPSLVQEALRPERERMQAFMDNHMERRAAAQDEQTLERLRKLDAFEEATGLHLRHMGKWELDRLGKLLTVLRNGTDLEHIANQMRGDRRVRRSTRGGIAMTVRNTGSDRELAEYIISYTEEYGFPPSRRQIAQHMGVSKTSAHDRLARLVKEGVIERAPGVPRGIKVNRKRLQEFGGK